MAPASSTRANARTTQQGSARAFYQHTSPRWLLRSCDYDPVMTASRRSSCQQRVRSELSLCGETVLPMLGSQSDVPSSIEMDPPYRTYELPSLNSPKPTRRRVEFNPYVKVSSRWSTHRSRSPNRSFSPPDLRGSRTRSGTMLSSMNSSVHSLRRGDSRLSPHSSFLSSVSQTPSSRRSLFCLKSGTDILPPPPQFRSDRSSSFIGLWNGRSSHDTSYLFSQSKSAGLNSSNSWDKRYPLSKPSAPVVPRPNPTFRATRLCASDVPVATGRFPPTSPRTSKENAAIKRDEDSMLFGSRKMMPETRPTLRRWMNQDRSVHRLYPRDQRTFSDLRLSKVINLGGPLKPRRETLSKYRPISDSGQRKISHVSPTCSGNVRKCDVVGADTARRTKTATGPSAQSWSMRARLNLSDFGKQQGTRETSPDRSSLRRRSPRRHEPTDKGHAHYSPKGTRIDMKVFSVPEVRLGHSLSTEDKLGIVQEWLKRKPSNTITGSTSDGGLCRYRMSNNTSSYLGGRPWNVPRYNPTDLRVGTNKFPSGDVAPSTGSFPFKKDGMDFRRLQDLRPDFCNVSHITTRNKSRDNFSFGTRSITPKSPIDNNSNSLSENFIYTKSSSEPYLHRSREYRSYSPLRTTPYSKATPSSSEPHVLHTKYPAPSRNASPNRSSGIPKTIPSERINSPGRSLRRTGSPNRIVHTSCKADQKLAESKSSKLHSLYAQPHSAGAVKPATSYDSKILYFNISPMGENKKVNKCRSNGRTGTPTTSKRVLKASTSPSSKKTSIPCDNKPVDKSKEQHKPTPFIKNKVVKNQVTNNEYVKKISSKRKKINLNLKIVSSEVEMPVRRNRRFEKTETKCTSIPQHSMTMPSMVPSRRFHANTEAKVSTPKSPKRSSTRNSSLRNASDDYPKTHVSRPTSEGHKESQKNANKTEGKVLRKEIARNKRSQKPPKRKVLRVQVPLPKELLQVCRDSEKSTDTLTRKSDSPKSSFSIWSPEPTTTKRSPMNENIPSTSSQKNKYIKTKKTTETTKVEVKEQKSEGTKPRTQAFSLKRQRTHISLEQRSSPDTTTIPSGYTEVECEKTRTSTTKTSQRYEKRSPVTAPSSTDMSSPIKDNSGSVENGTRNNNQHPPPRSKVKLSRSRFKENSQHLEGDRNREVKDGLGNNIRLTMKKSETEVKEVFDALPLHNQYALNDLSALLGIARLLNIDAESCLNMVSVNVSGKKTK